MQRIREPRLLLVEGRDEVNLFKALISDCFDDDPGIQVIDAGGKDNGVRAACRISPPTHFARRRRLSGFSIAAPSTGGGNSDVRMRVARWPLAWRTASTA